MNIYYDFLQKYVLELEGYFEFGVLNIPDEKQKYLKEAAYNFLVRFTTVDFGMDAQAWRNWL